MPYRRESRREHFYHINAIKESTDAPSKLSEDRNIELRGKLRKKAIWQKMRNKPLAKLIRKVF